jgi:hypothetical protein
MKKEINNNTLSYCVLKVFYKNSGGIIESKISFITWLGGNIKSMVKASSGNHSTKLIEAFSPIIYVDVNKKIDSFDDLNLKFIFPDLDIIQKNDIKNDEKIEEKKEEKIEEKKEEIKEEIKEEKTKTSQFKKSTGQISKIGDLQIEGPNDVLAYLKELFLDSNDTNWVSLGYIKTGVIGATNKGIEGLEELKKELKEGEIQFIFYRTIAYGSPKIVLIIWVGKNVKGLQKSKSGSQAKALIDFSKQAISISIEYPASQLDDLNEDDIQQKLTGIKGGDKSLKSYGSSSNLKVNVKSENIEKNETTPVPKSFGSSKFGGRGSDLLYEDNIQIAKDFKELNDSKSDTMWLMFGYIEQYKVKIVQKGSGGCDDFKKCKKKN